ncbi:retinoblastoma-related protein (macronuclear) [Tetrahymena thermophila SB210]|uniref:Retinoblastoma-related protein n=1 Tax=Tetrahymena thermophila (strain SB210) TaxID=312017 RepID=Q231Q1_TETTS|nr:retinoblastoma-related protein [Tetrahymena thermophila SB210]EAR91251.2 retinoblastoma-related protein [Tetrahymena thermophila SB210]|eukprot:XP_001011496.2 retinoblastoma-related protein [Tetrahymena thermophila SB210]
MEDQLEIIQKYFDNPEINQSIEDILEQYLNNATCEFTAYQKSVYPICAAFYMVLENREKEAERLRIKQKSPQTPQQQETQYSASGIQDESINNKENIRLQQKDQKLTEEVQSNSSCSSPSDKQKEENKVKKVTNVSVIELRNKFYSRGQIDQLLKTMAEFSQVLKDREYYEVIQSKLESIKRNHSLFVKFTHVLDCFYTETELIQKHYMQRIIWRLYLLLKEQLLKQNSEVDIEQCVYLLHFICSEALKYAGKTAQSLNNNVDYYTHNSGLHNSAQQSSNLKQYVNFQTVSEQVNAILLKSKLEIPVMQEQSELFVSLLVNLFEKIYQLKSKEESSQQNHLNENKMNRNLNSSNSSSSSSDTSCLTETKEKAQHSASNIDEEKESELANTATKNSQQISSQITDTSNALIADSFSSLQSLEKLSKLLEKEIKKYPIIEEHEFLQKEEEFLQSIQTPKAKHISSMHLQQGPPGVTKDYQESKYQISNLNHTNASYFKKTLFNNDEQNLSLNSKLSDLERPSSPVGNHGLQQNQACLLADAGQIQHPHTPKTPHDIYKMPFQRSHQPLLSAPAIQSTPLSNALDNSKWINMYSKSDPIKKIEELMNKINKEYKSQLLEEASQIARDVYYSVKKKNEVSGTDGIEYKVQKVLSFFQNVLEKLISDEEQKNFYKENVLISLLKNKSFIFSVLANCIMTHCFVKDIKGVNLEMVIKQSKITSLDYWRVISNFAKFDRHIPESIKQQLFNIEKQILLYIIWEEKECLMQNALKKFQQDLNKDQPYEHTICRRLIYHSATRVKEISKILELDDKIQERIWEALLYVYRSQLQLMNRRYVDQIIICSIYALSLISAELFVGKEIKFKGMLSACENLLHFNSEKVKKTTNDQGESIDIINFYNQIFLKPMKPYFKSSNNNHIGVHEQANTNQMLNVPLRLSVPANFINYTPILKEDMRVTLTPMTPVTQKLQATESMESPFVNQYNFLNRNNAFRQQQQQQFQQNPKNMINRVNILNNQQSETPKQATQTLTVLGQSYISVPSENINGTQEKKNRDGLQGSKVFQNFNNQTFVGGTPTQESSDTNTSPKFGTGNSSNFFNQNKKFLEDNIEELNNQNANPQQLKRCNSIFGPKTLNLNSDEEVPSKLSKTNNNSEKSTVNTENKAEN